VRAPRGGTETVLVAEDETAILELAREILEQLGYTVLTARTPEDAIRSNEEHPGPIHLLITDVVMPQMNGRQLAERLVAARSGLKCLYMSGYTANVIAHRGVLEEGVSFIAKPFSLASLAKTVREVLDS
jgi:two-component system cell cycle sensor histidine kinase/response regulator CckA